MKPIVLSDGRRLVQAGRVKKIWSDVIYIVHRFSLTEAVLKAPDESFIIVSREELEKSWISTYKRSGR